MQNCSLHPKALQPSRIHSPDEKKTSQLGRKTPKPYLWHKSRSSPKKMALNPRRKTVTNAFFSRARLNPTITWLHHTLEYLLSDRLAINVKSSLHCRIFFYASAARAGHCRRQERGGQQERQESKRVTCRQAKPTATGEWQVLLLSKPAVRPPRPTLLPEGGSDRVTRNTKEMPRNVQEIWKEPNKYRKIQNKY